MSAHGLSVRWHTTALAARRIRLVRLPEHCEIPDVIVPVHEQRLHCVTACRPMARAIPLASARTRR